MTDMTRSFPKAQVTQGATATLLILGMAVFLGVLVMMTMTMNLAGIRKATSNQVGQEVQYAAESSLSRANARLNMYRTRIQGITIVQGTTMAQISSELARICGMSALPIPNSLTGIPASGQRICNAANRGQPTADQLKFFITRSTPPAGMTADAWQQEWVNAFRGPANTLVDQSSATITSSRGTTSTPVNGGLLLDGVSMLSNGALRVDFSVSPLTAEATLSSNDQALARRRYVQDGSRSYGLSVMQPSYSLYQYLVNRRITPAGARLNFWDGDSFQGRVHVNGTAGIDGPLFLANTLNGGARFYGRFTTSANYLEWNANTTYKPSASTMFRGGYQFGAPPIDMPRNAVKQRLAAAGIDPLNCPNSDSTDPTTAENAIMACLASVFGSQVTTTDGVYYSTGSSTAPNTGTGFAGGIYVRGNITNLQLTTVNNLQRIAITQGTKTTTFTQTGLTSWTVADGTTTKTFSSSTFNGMLYVEGNIGNSTTKGSNGLMGDGTNTGDIAPDMQMTIAAKGDIYLKKSVTYSTSPSADPNAKNVLGLFSERGNFLLDGQNDQDLTLNGSLIAASAGKGFGTVNYNNVYRFSSGGSQPKINLMGGIIEEQSQGVGITSTTGAGYSRNFSWDSRFDNPLFTPPYFPTQQNFMVSDDIGATFILNRNFRAVSSE